MAEWRSGRLFGCRDGSFVSLLGWMDDGGTGGSLPNVVVEINYELL